MNYEFARKILGPDFISPEEISTLCYTSTQLEHFTKTIPSKDFLTKCEPGVFVLLAGPPQEMKICNIPNYELLRMPGRYGNADSDDIIGAEWLMIRKIRLSESTHKTHDEQEKMARDLGEYIPSAVELAWPFVVYKQVKGVLLFDDGFFSRTSSYAKSNHKEIALASVHNGNLYIENCYGTTCADDLGLISAKKLR